jgi:soluble lytic murein transglycosylase-like protein
MTRLPLTAVCTLLLIQPTAADAQIFLWHDANGSMVLSDKTIDAPTDVYLVEGAPQIRTTRKIEAPGGPERYDSFVIEHSAKQSLRPELVRAVIQVESGFNPRARSPKGAMGLMQLMPQTARELGVVNPYDPEENIRGGTTYLRQLLDRYAGDVRLALAAYNAGSGAVDRHGGTVPPYRETREYVKKVGNAVDGGRSINRGKLVIYKTIEIVDERVVPRYSTEKPEAGTFEIVRR